MLLAIRRGANLSFAAKINAGRCGEPASPHVVSAQGGFEVSWSFGPLPAAGAGEKLQFLGPAHGGTPAVHPELFEDVLGVGSQRVERDGKLIGDFGAAQIGA
jgi:hypothetical protein